MKKITLLGCCLFLMTATIAQNTCPEAMLIVSGVTYTVDEVNGAEVPLPLCADQYGSTDVDFGEWYMFVPSEDASLTVTTDLPQNSGKDTRFHVYTGTCGQANLSCVGGDDDGGNGLLSTDTFNVVQGTTYYIAFDDRWSTDGFDFTLIEEAPSASSPITFSSQSITITGGVNKAVVDMNNDFLDDIVAVTSTNVNILFQQSGGGFTTVNIPTPTANYTPSWSIAAGDIDKNGYTDLLYGNGSGVTFMKANVNAGNLDNGNPFDDVDGFTEMSGNQSIFSQRSNFVDINNDGHMDAFVCHDIAPNVYYINDGSGNFTFNQGGLGDYATGGNYGSIWIDYDNDGDLDMFIAKCGGEEARRRNQMLRNNGNGTYTEVAGLIGLSDPMQTWSSAWGDFDNDGDMDVFVGASSGTHKLMRNDLDSNLFTDVSITSGVTSLATTGHENLAFDFDNDGNIDIVSNGNILFGNGDLTFTKHENLIPYLNGSFGDLNNDGFLDAVVGSGTNVNVYYNSGSANNWIKIHTVGTVSNGNGVGARVEVYTAAGKQIRDVRSGEGFAFMSSLNTHFGIGQETTITKVIVRWPSGLIDEINSPTINQALTVIEGDHPLSVPDNSISDITIYPNPASDVIYISTTGSLINKVATVFDIQGKRVLNERMLNNALDVSKLQSGLYVLRFEADGKVLHRKFIKD